jgi:L-amino acid N-acyltransferase YncA
MSTEVGESVLIRNARKDDLSRIFEIFREAFRLEAPSEQQLLGFLEQCPHGMLVAQIGDEIAGATVAFIREGRPHLYGTAVAPEFRRHRGVGSRLVGSQLSNFQKLGYREMDTIIGCTNSISIGTADKVGFKHVQTMRNFFSYPRMSARLYVKSLASDGNASIKGPNLRDRANDLWARVMEPRLNRRLQVAWFERWRPALDNALYELPGMENCPHELFRLMMQNPSSTRKVTALVIDGDRPVAVLGLREKGQYWMPAMQGIIPESIGPARDGFLFPALKAIRADVRIAGSPIPPPKSVAARNVTAVPIFGIDCQADFEEYWRKSGYMKTIRLARNRTKAFRFEVDRPGSAALIIANWEKQWRDHPDQQTIIASDLIIAAEYCEERHQHHSFLLLDGDVPAAGITGLVHGNDLLATVVFRNKTYDWHYVGTRILDLLTQWAAEQGFAKLDMGGWYSYKAKWAPEVGEQWDFRLCPLRKRLVSQVIWKAHGARGKLKALLNRVRLPSGDPEGEQDDEVGASEPQEVPQISEDASPVHSPTAGASRSRDV